MFTVAFLFWWLSHLRALFGKRVKRELATARREGRLADRKSIGNSLYPVVRAYAYAAWFGEVAYLRSSAGGSLDFTPSMPGVNPKFVDEVLREELRVRDGKVTAPIGELAERISRKLGTLIDETARETSRRAALSEDEHTVRRSLDYAEKHGHPVARFLGMVDDEKSEIGKVIRADQELNTEVRDLIDDYEEEFTAEEADAELEAELARIDAEFDAKVRDEARQTLREAEIRLGLRDEHGNKWPIGWARVPVGPFTCPFCLLLCSRGPVYRSSSVVLPSNRIKKALPVAIGAYGAPAFHWGCDCLGVCVRDINDFDGVDAWRGAENLYDRFLEENPPDAAEFTKWLDTDEGKAAAEQLIPGMQASSKDWRKQHPPKRRRKR